MGLEAATIGVALALSLCGAVQFPYPESAVLKNETHAENGEYIEYGNVVPIHYNLILDFVNAKTVWGVVEIRVKFLKQTDLIHLHAEDMTVDAVTIGKEKNPTNDQKRAELNGLIPNHWEEGVPEAHFLRIKLATAIKRDQIYTFEIRFHCPYSSTDKGLRKSPHRAIHGNEIGFLSTNFNPIYARRVFPCFDMPWFSSTFRLELKTGPEYHAYSYVREHVVYGARKKSTTFNFDKIATNELAFYIFRTDNRGDDFFISESYSKPVTYVDKGCRMIFTETDVYWIDSVSTRMASPNVMAFYNFDVNERDGGFTDVNLMVLGQEYQDNSQYFTWDIRTVKNAGLKRNQLGSRLIEMEPKTWRSHWLKDGLVTFLRFLHAAETYPREKEKLMEMFAVSMMMKAMSVDQLPVEKQLDKHGVDTPSILEKGDTGSWILVILAAALIRTLYLIAGEKEFLAVTKNFVEKTKGVLLDPDEYYKQFEHLLSNWKLDKDTHTLKDVFESWVNQPGYQIVLSKITKNGTELVISLDDSIKTPTKSWVPYGNYFLNQNLADPRHDDVPNISNKYRQRIKINNRFTRNIAFGWWRPTDEHNITISLSNECQILNFNYLGYYRIMYDDDTWRYLIKCLSNDKYRYEYPALNRAQLIDDAFFFSKNRKLNFKTTFGLVETFVNEIDIIPWIALHENLQYIEKLFRQNSRYVKYLAFKKHLTKKFLDHFVEAHGLVVKNDERQVVRSTRMLVLRIGSEVERTTITHFLKQEFKKVLNNSAATLHRDHHFDVLCYGIKKSNESVFDVIMARYDNASSVARKLLIAESLGCSNNYNLTDKILHLVQKNHLTVIEKTKILQRLVQEKKIILIKVLNFLNSNKDRIKKTLGGEGLRDLIETMSNRLSSGREMIRLNDLIEYWVSKGVLSKTLDDAILTRVNSTTNANKDWIFFSSIEVKDWIKDFEDRVRS